MNFSKLLLYLLIITGLTFSCSKDKDEDAQGGVPNCEAWFEGNPCVEMRLKFEGNYEGGAGYCGLYYEYEVTLTQGVINGITIGIANPGDPILYTFDAVLINSEEFEIPYQEVFISSASAGHVSGYGNLVDDVLSYHLIVESVGECDHVATKV